MSSQPSSPCHYSPGRDARYQAGTRSASGTRPLSSSDFCKCHGWKHSEWDFIRLEFPSPSNTKKRKKSKIFPFLKKEMMVSELVEVFSIICLSGRWLAGVFRHFLPDRLLINYLHVCPTVINNFNILILTLIIEP